MSEAEDRRLRERLRALRVDPPDDGFSAGLRRKLLAAGPPARAWPAWLSSWRGLLWPAFGTAAGALVALALVLRTLGGAVPAPSARLLPAQVAVVRLDLAADRPVDAARVTVSLPPGLVFWANGHDLAERELSWSQPLAAGSNEIPIAVQGRAPGRYRIAVEARIGQDRVQDEIVLEVTRG